MSLSKCFLLSFFLVLKIYLSSCFFKRCLYFDESVLTAYTPFMKSRKVCTRKWHTFCAIFLFLWLGLLKSCCFIPPAKSEPWSKLWQEGENTKYERLACTAGSNKSRRRHSFNSGNPVPTFCLSEFVLPNLLASPGAKIYGIAMSGMLYESL